MIVTSAPRPVVISTEVEKSPAPVGQAAWRWEISRLRASIELRYLYPIPARSPARNDMWGDQLYSHGKGKQMDRYFPRPVVISANSGQTPIGKPPNRLAALRPLPAGRHLSAIPHLLFLPRFFALWRPCRGSPSQPKLALRRAEMEQHYHS